MRKDPSRRGPAAGPSLSHVGSRTRPALAFITVFLAATAASSQCPGGTVTIIADRDNTLYEDASGMLSNGAGDHLFAGVTGSNRIVRGMVHFDVAGAIPPGATIGNASLLMTLNQPVDHGTHMVRLHRVLADWGEGASLAPMGEGQGGPAMMGDATWLHTYFGASTWTNPGGDFEAVASAATTVDGNVGGSNTWNEIQMSLDAQAWLDSPATNFGWMVQGEEGVGTTSLRFNSRTNSLIDPVLCLELCPGAGSLCPAIFSDGFESGNTSAWSNTVP